MRFWYIISGQGYAHDENYVAVRMCYVAPAAVRARKDSAICNGSRLYLS
jgi:hypothetical protein